MTHEQKISYMRIAANMCRFGFSDENIDLLVSLYELVIKKEGNSSVNDVVKTESEVKKRHEKKEELKPN